MVRLITGEQACNNQTLTQRGLGWQDKSAAGARPYGVEVIEEFRLAPHPRRPAAAPRFSSISIANRMAAAGAALERLR